MKILVIGSSHVGALYKGWESLKQQHCTFDVCFAGYLYRQLRKASVSNGVLEDVPFSSHEQLPHMRELDAFIVAADLPSVRLISRGILGRDLSQQVEAAAISDAVSESHNAFIMKTLIRPFSDAPVVFLSIPERRSNLVPMSISDFELARSYLSTAVQREGAHYLPQAPRTLNGDFVPLAEYYEGAINMEGKIAGRQAQTAIGHFNEHGGRESIKSALEFLMSDVFRTEVSC